MISSDFQIYNSELAMFLQTVTIKFSPFINVLNENVLANGYTVDEDDPLSWKYYINAQGEYHESDTIMTIRSLDTGETIAYTKTNLAAHPKTRSAYNIGNQEYLNLCNAYPEQVDLIKSITYPITDILEFIAADDLTLHGFSDSILEENEHDVVITEYKNFLEFIRTRWYLESLGYEDHYYTTFWMLVWQASLMWLHAIRIKYLHTEYTHSFHIWEHLKSNGLSDYRDVLTNTKAAFLYRNIEYLLANSGKTSNLSILTENLLGDLSVAMIGEYIYQSTEDTRDDAVWKPKILALAIDESNSLNFADGDPVPVADMTERLYVDGYDPNSGADYAEGVETDLRYTTFNVLPTKLLEIKKYNIDNKYFDILTRFVLDNLVYRVNNDTYIGDVVIIEKTSAISFKVNYKDAIALLHYVCCRAGWHNFEKRMLTEIIDGIEYPVEDTSDPLIPINLPTKYTLKGIYKTHPDANNIPEYLNYFGHPYKVSREYNVQDVIDSVPQYTTAFSSQLLFAEHLAEQFNVLVYDIRRMRKQASKIKNLCLTTIYEELLLNGDIALNLSEYTTYEEWLPTISGMVPKIIAAYDELDDPAAAYDELANQIIEELVPVSSDIFGVYSIDTEATNKLYARLKALFVQLCSYNVLFLDTERNTPVWAISARQLESHVTTGSTTTFGDIDNPNSIKVFHDSGSDKVVYTNMLLNADASISIDNGSLMDVELGTDVKDMTISGNKEIRPELALGANIKSNAYSDTLYAPVGISAISILGD